MLETLPYLCFVALTIEQLSKREGGKKQRMEWDGMGSYWGGGRTLSRHDCRKFVFLLIEYILHFLLSHPIPFTLTT